MSFRIEYNNIRKCLEVAGGYSESEINRMTKELALITIRHPTKVYIEFTKGIAICYSEPKSVSSRTIIGLSKSDEKLADDNTMVKSNEVSILLESMAWFQECKEEVLTLDNQVNKYGVSSVIDAIFDLKSLDVELLESNIKIFKNGGKKFYRLTYTPTKGAKKCGLSRVEFAFGHTIDGFTYIVEKETYRDNKLLFKLKN
jgi:ribosomal protein L23